MKEYLEKNESISYYKCVLRNDYSYIKYEKAEKKEEDYSEKNANKVHQSKPVPNGKNISLEFIAPFLFKEKPNEAELDTQDNEDMNESVFKEKLFRNPMRKNVQKLMKVYEEAPAFLKQKQSIKSLYNVLPKFTNPEVYENYRTKSEFSFGFSDVHAWYTLKNCETNDEVNKILKEYVDCISCGPCTRFFFNPTTLFN